MDDKEVVLEKTGAQVANVGQSDSTPDLYGGGIDVVDGTICVCGHINMLAGGLSGVDSCSQSF